MNGTYPVRHLRPLYGGVYIANQPDLNNIRRLDMLPQPMLLRMQQYGIAIDREYFHSLTSQLSAEMDALKMEIACHIPADALDQFVSSSPEVDEYLNVESSVQLAKLLFDTLHIGAGKDLKRTAAGDRISTGKKQLETLKGEHDVIKLILDYRERSKLRNTYTSKLPLIARHHPRGYCPHCQIRHRYETWRVHTTFTTTRTDTGRLASKDPNLQNIPARSALGRAVRAGFIASPGYRLLGRDFGQIELRLLAHCAIEQNLIDIFQHNEDPHLKTACRAFQKDYTYWSDIAARSDAKQLTDTEKKAWGEFKLLYRAPCKNVNFGVVYGLSGPGLFDLMAITYATAGIPLPDWCTVEWCDKFIQDWFALYPDVHAYMEKQYHRARRYGKVWDIFGRTRPVPEVRSVHKWIQSAGLRQSGNMPIQSAGAGLMKLVMGEIEEWLNPNYDSPDDPLVKPLLSIHDELIFEAEEEICEGFDNLCSDFFANVMRGHCRVPIASDGKIMERWVKE